MCNSSNYECLETIDTQYEECYRNCEGLYVSSYIFSELVDNKFQQSFISEYEKYKGKIKFPLNLKSRFHQLKLNHVFSTK